MAGKILKLATSTTAPPPPRPLGRHGRALWDGITSECIFEDAAGRELLCAACQALDRAEDCAEQIAIDGPVIRKGGTIREHPALKHELASRAFLVRTLARLGLDSEPIRAVGRPPAKSYPIA